MKYIGWYIGKLEASLLLQKKEYGYPYWIDVFLWLSILFGFMMTVHSSFRAATRLFVYFYIIKIIGELVMRRLKNQGSCVKIEASDIL